MRQPQQWHMAARESFYQLPTWLSPPSKSRPSPLETVSAPQYGGCAAAGEARASKGWEARIEGKRSSCQQTTCKPLGTPPPLNPSIYLVQRVFSFVRKRKVSSVLSQTHNLESPQWKRGEMLDRLLNEWNRVTSGPKGLDDDKPFPPQ